VSLALLRHRSIGTKLVVVTMSTTAVALLVACGGLLLYDQYTARRSSTERLAAVSEILAEQSSAALAFSDDQAARETLQSLHALPDVTLACLMRPDGTELARYQRTPGARPCPSGRDGIRAAAGGVVLIRPVRMNERRAGTLAMEVTLDALAVRLRHGLWLVAALFAVGGSIAFLLSRRLQHVIARPIQDLARTAQQVSAERTYDRRAIRHGNDELGQLVDRFNEMLAEIQARDAELRGHRDRLESAVADRTTDLVSLNRDLTDARDRAEAASLAKSEFLANMSHELRTPMNGVLGMTELVLLTPLSTDQRENITTAYNSAASLLDLLNDILDFSKIEAGKFELDAAPFEVAQFVESTIAVVRLTAERKGLGLELDVDPSLPPWLVGDASRLRQVLVNLIGNAVKFTEKGAVRLSLGVEPTDDGRVRVRFGVKDTGIGIAADKHEKIFEAFIQADGSTTRRFGGTGLGLAISNRLVGLMGSRLELESAPGKGSLFHFAVELSVDTGVQHDSQPSRAATSARAAEIIAKARSGLRVLLAEDNLVNQRVAARFLQRLGHIVTVANDGREAVAHWQAAPFDLILMDVQMPEMDGFEAVAAIRDLERTTGGRIPILALTAHAMSGDRERCLAAGMDGYLTKPMKLAQLVDAIEDVLPAAA
jgi:signal transduction histidine kinase/ActR/RegA family two-component response regulator